MKRTKLIALLLCAVILYMTLGASSCGNSSNLNKGKLAAFDIQHSVDTATKALQIAVSNNELTPQDAANIARDLKAVNSINSSLIDAAWAGDQASIQLYSQKLNDAVNSFVHSDAVVKNKGKQTFIATLADALIKNAAIILSSVKGMK